MNRNIFVVTMTLFSVSLLPAKAQVVIDMPDHMQAAARFRSGEIKFHELVDEWLFQRIENLNVLDFRYLERNTRKVVAYCKTHRAETLMSAIQKNAR